MQTSKLKTLLVYKILEQYSDESNPLSTTDIIQVLNYKYNIECERKSIYADVKALNEVGFDIVSTKSPKIGFFMATRQFQLPEVRLLIDAVNSVGFITPKKTKELIQKLETLVSTNQANQLQSQVYMDSNLKCENEQVYLVIDALNTAITNNNKVKFVYSRRNIDVKTKKSFTQKTFTVSPYALIFKEDHYYLVCNSSKYDNLMNLRVDRIRKVEQLDMESRPVNEVSDYLENLDIADYSAKMFNMFTGDVCEVSMICDLSLREEIIDRFGKKAPLNIVDSTHFTTTIQAAVSDGLVSWLMKFGDKIKITSPTQLQNQIKEKAQSIANMY